MKTKIYSIDGKTGKEIEIPKYFSQKIREDIVARVLETKKRKQPYAPGILAGQQSSISGKIVHKRHCWKSQYGRGMSRIPRKTMSRRGTQFNWVGANVPNTRGGRRAHPPKIEAMTKILKINKKELKLALISALSATANEKYLENKYSSIEKINKSLPLIVESKAVTLKAKEFLKMLENMLGELTEIAIKTKKIRAGKGKRRGRKYKKSAGMLFVVGKEENLKTGLFEVKKAGNISATDLAKGGLGRLTIYTEKAISELNAKLGEK